MLARDTQLVFDFTYYPPGLHPDTLGVACSVVLDRLDELVAGGWLPQAVADRWIVELPDDPSQKVPAAEMVEWLEDYPHHLVEPYPKWGRVCEHLLPEWFADPPTSKKCSEAAPGTHAGLECLTRRKAGGQQLWHPRDTQGAGGVQRARRPTPPTGLLRLSDPTPQADYIGKVPAWWPISASTNNSITLAKVAAPLGSE